MPGSTVFPPQCPGGRRGFFWPGYWGGQVLLHPHRHSHALRGPHLPLSMYRLHVQIWRWLACLLMDSAVSGLNVFENAALEYILQWMKIMEKKDHKRCEERYTRHGRMTEQINLWQWSHLIYFGGKTPNIIWHTSRTLIHYQGLSVHIKQYVMKRSGCGLLYSRVCIFTHSGADTHDYNYVLT